MRRNRRWTQEDELELLRLLIGGKSITAAAKKINRTTSSAEARTRMLMGKLNKKVRSDKPKPSGQSRQGRRKHLGLSVRSSWEANFLTMLNHQKIKWSYEPKVFIFYEIERGTRAYLPDVYLPDKDIWIEVKGRLRPGDKTKTKRFKKYYPEEFAKLHCVVKNPKVEAAVFYKSMGVPVYIYYDEMVKKYSNLKNWEG
jgi:hypothetical protein